MIAVLATVEARVMSHRASRITESGEDPATLAEVLLFFGSSRREIGPRSPAVSLELVPHRRHGRLHIVSSTTFLRLAMAAVHPHVRQRMIKLVHVRAHRFAMPYLRRLDGARIGGDGDR